MGKQNIAMLCHNKHKFLHREVIAIGRVMGVKES